MKENFKNIISQMTTITQSLVESAEHEKGAELVLWLKDNICCPGHAHVIVAQAVAYLACEEELDKEQFDLMVAAFREGAVKGMTSAPGGEA